MHAAAYQEAVLDTKCRAAIQEMKDDILQHDLAPAHRAKTTKAWMEDHGVLLDLNPIENLRGVFSNTYTTCGTSSSPSSKFGLLSRLLIAQDL